MGTTPPPPPVPRPQPPAAPTYYCAYCGKRLHNMSADSCPSCGAPTAEALLRKLPTPRPAPSEQVWQLSKAAPPPYSGDDGWLEKRPPPTRLTVEQRRMLCVTRALAVLLGLVGTAYLLFMLAAILSAAAARG